MKIKTQIKTRKIFMAQIQGNEKSLEQIIYFVNALNGLIKKQKMIPNFDRSCMTLSEKALGEYWNDPENEIWDRI